VEEVVLLAGIQVIQVLHLLPVELLKELFVFQPDLNLLAMSTTLMTANQCVRIVDTMGLGVPEKTLHPAIVCETIAVKDIESPVMVVLILPKMFVMQRYIKEEK